MTKGNLNNHIGVPLTLLGLRREHTHAVIEMGANHRGEIAHLASIAQPTVGLVTNAAAAHLEGFGSLEGVAAAKGELFSSLPPTGVAVVNADDRFARIWNSTAAGDRRVAHLRRRSAGRFHRSNMSPRASVPAWPSSGIRSRHAPPPANGPVSALAGVHNLRNALGAAAAAALRRTSRWAISRAGLAAVRPVKGRLEFKPAINGALLVDDSVQRESGIAEGRSRCLSRRRRGPVARSRRHDGAWIRRRPAARGDWPICQGGGH